MWRKMFSSTTTELSISRESTSASPPRTMVLMVLPEAFSSRNAARHDTGIDISTEMVPRIDPRKTRIITAVRIRPMPPSRSTLAIGCLHDTATGRRPRWRPATWERRAGF